MGRRAEERNCATGRAALGGWHGCFFQSPRGGFSGQRPEGSKKGALIVRIGFWGPLYYNYDQKPPIIVLVIIRAPILLPEAFVGVRGSAARAQDLRSCQTRVLALPSLRLQLLRQEHCIRSGSLLSACHDRYLSRRCYARTFGLRAWDQPPSRDPYRQDVGLKPKELERLGRCSTPVLFSCSYRNLTDPGFDVPRTGHKTSINPRPQNAQASSGPSAIRNPPGSRKICRHVSLLLAVIRRALFRDSLSDALAYATAGCSRALCC